MSDHVSITELKVARRKVAKLFLTDRVYLPILERLESEIAVAEQQNDLLDRARAYAA